MSPIIFLSHKNKNLITIFFSKLSVHFSCVCMFSCFSHVKLIVILRGLQPYVAPQAPLSMGFSRQECCSGLPWLLPGVFPTQGSNPSLLCLLHCRQICYLLGHWGSPQYAICTIAERSLELYSSFI